MDVPSTRGADVHAVRPLYVPRVELEALAGWPRDETTHVLRRGAEVVEVRVRRRVPSGMQGLAAARRPISRFSVEKARAVK